LLDAGGRASENFPGANSEPVKGLRGMKGKILETTVGWVRGKEETETGIQTISAELQSYGSNKIFLLYPD
jgi:hypothetical protein